VARTGGTSLNLRAEPGTSQPVLAGLTDGAPLVQIGGPIEADGLTWVKVRDDSGRVGWVAQQFVAPGNQSQPGA
jgi:uncharacterized protein YraI